MEWVWDVFLNWSDLAQRGADAVTYALMAAVGTLLFTIRLVIAMFAGEGGDFDVDVDPGTDASFTLFSLLSVTAFIMGTGWMGLACRFDWDLSRPVSVVVAVGFGATMMFTASGMMFMTRKLNRNITYDPETAVGKSARVYMTVPPKGQGQGQVQVSVSGRLKTMDAVSAGPPLAAHADVRVVGVRDDDTLIVTPHE